MPDVATLMARVKELEGQASAAKALPAVVNVSPSEGDLDSSPDLSTFLSPQRERQALAVVENNANEEDGEKPADLGSSDIDNRWEKYDQPLVSKDQPLVSKDQVWRIQKEGSRAKQEATG